MAPPTPIMNATEVEPLLSIARNCYLSSLVQNECYFNGYDYTCVPFKRLFQECIVHKKKVRIEVTTSDTNMH
ncbi:HCR023Wp [Eremothecium sinecaudum]|uniref:HCR023Wp n=1 Tax=Eremothecium sinecaudum TaxID=45286 RepID=A0A109UYV6_9SACH|nr:HCR023Wp [Eremothecium sinecaudum]AMD20173.1 HCR023Wp [Eremothecium sinecaudum]